MARVYSKPAINESNNSEEEVDDSSDTSESLSRRLLIACESNSVDSVKMVIGRDGDIAWSSRSEDGFSGLHISSKYGYVEIVKELVKVNGKFCLVLDKQGRIPLHVAVMEGRVEVVRELVGACPESLSWVTPLGETAFHLALKYHQLDCFEVLMEVLEKNEKVIKLQEQLLNRKDHQLNTVLHIASHSKQTRIIWRLLRNNLKQGPMVQVDATNQDGLTACQLYSENIPEMVDKDICQLFRKSGAHVINRGKSVQSSFFNHRPVRSVHQLFDPASMERVMLQDKSPPPLGSKIKRKMGVEVTTLVVSVFILFAGGSYAGLLNFRNIYPLNQLTQNATTLNVIDMISIPGLVPDGFYFIVFNTVTYVLGMGLILAAIWFIEIPWLFSVRALMLLLVTAISITYALMVNKFVPQFSMNVLTGFFNVSSFVAVWVFVVCLLLLLFALGFMVKQFVSICSKRSRRAEDQNGIGGKRVVDHDLEAGGHKLLQNNETAGMSMT